MTWAQTALALLLAGCALQPKYISPRFVPPARVAVLPMNNQSNDLRGPEVVRGEFWTQLRAKGYAGPSLEETDRILKEKFGITDGGQLNAAAPQRLAEALSADALVYGELVDFNFVNIGFYRDKYVTAAFKMIAADSGGLLWEDERKASKKELETDPKKAGEALVKGIAERALRNVTETPLLEQARQAVRMILSTLPAAR